MSIISNRPLVTHMHTPPAEAGVFLYACIPTPRTQRQTGRTERDKGVGREGFAYEGWAGERDGPDAIVDLVT